MILPTQKKRAPMNERTLIAYFSRKGFNYLNGQIVKDEMMLNNAASELLDLMETWAEREVAGIAPPTTLGVVRAARSSGGQGAPIAQSRAAAGSA